MDWRRKARGAFIVGGTLAAALAIATSVDAASGTWALTWGKDVDSVAAGTGLEVCTIAANCKAGTVGTLGGEFTTPDNVAVDSSGNVFVADGNVNRVQEFSASGSFIRAWGKDVIQTGKPGDTGTGAEICTAATDCKGGTTGGLGGEFNDPEGIATDAAGNVYVDDELNHRVQVFDSSGHFLRTWGKDVIQSGHTGDTGTGFEVCSVAADCQAGTVGTLGGELSRPFGISVAGSNVYVTDLDNERVQKYSSAGSFQRTWGQDVIQSGHAGDTGTGAEICTVAADCQAGSSTAFLGGDFDGVNEVAADTFGNVYVTDFGNGRVQKFDSSGNFLRTWGKDVIQSGKPGDTGTGYEICTVAADCKDGLGGTLGGEFGIPEGITTDPTGEVYVTDINARRIEKFDPSGNFERLWGKDVIQSGAPGDTGTGFEICTVAANCKAGTNGALGGEFANADGIAADAAGNVYVVDPSNNRVQKFVDAAASSTGGGGTGAPSNLFTFGKLKGRALDLVLGSAGSVDVVDASVKGRLASSSKVTRLLKHSHASGGPGLVTVGLKLTAVAKKRLRHDGKVKVNAKVTFTPTGGTKRIQTKLLKIKQ